MLVKKGEIQAGQEKRPDVVKGGKVVYNSCEGIRGDPFEFFVLRQIERTNVVTGLPQAGSEPGLKLGEGV